MTVTYQPVLVLLSIGVAILGSLTALALTSGSDDAESDAWLTSFALANGGVIMGGTIWSMHFIAMMAVDFPILVNYNLIENTPLFAQSLLAYIIAVGIAVVSAGNLSLLALLSLQNRSA